jgi:hypothetical protein
MMENSNKYFNCEISSKYGCCRSCDKVTLINKCKNCIDDCEVTGPTYDGWEWRTKKQACPPDFSGRGYDANRYHMESISWDFKDEDAKKSFFNDVLEAVGVEEKYLTFPEHATHHKATLAYDNCYGYPPSPTGLPGYDDLPDGACKAEHWWHYGPQISSSFTVAQVPNPKDDVNKILSTVDIDAALSEVELGILADEYDEDSSELVEALILPIFMMSGGLEHMKTVVEMAKEIEESERISLIMNLVTALLLLVGGFGGVLAGTGGSAALRIMGQAMVVTAEAGNTAVGIYTAVESPNTIPLLVFGLVMSASGLRSATNVHKAAYYTKNMPTADIAKTNPYAGRMAGIARTTNTKGPINYCRWG